MGQPPIISALVCPWFSGVACGQWAEAAYGAYAVLRCCAFEKRQAGAVAVIGENDLLPVSAALRDVVRATGYDDSGYAKHEAIIHPPRKSCKSTCRYLAARGKSPNAAICSVPLSVAGVMLGRIWHLRRTPGAETGRYRTFATGCY